MKLPLLAIALLVTQAPAGVLYYLPFATGYNPAAVVEDGLVGQGVAGHGNFVATPSPAVGWDTDLLPTSLRYADSAGNALVTTGGAAYIDTSEETGTVSNIAPLMLTGVNAPAGQSIWLSFIGQQTAGTTARFFNLSLRAPDNTVLYPGNVGDSGTSPDEVCAFGMQSGSVSQVWQVWDRSTKGVGSTVRGTIIPSTNLVFILARVDLNYDGNKDRFTMWVNPPLGSAPAEADGVSFVSTNTDFNGWADLDHIRLAAGYQDATGPSSSWKVDEIRIGDTREDVCPYLPFTLTTVTLPTGEMRVTWQAAPGFTDTVEWSDDLGVWHPHAASSRVNPPGSVTATWDTPVITASRYFLRVTRL